MISTALASELANKQSIADISYDDLLSAQQNRDARQAAVDELNRQLAYHLSHGDNVNANVVNGQIPQAQGYLDQAKKTYADALEKYRIAVNDYLSAKNKLSPADRATRDALDQTDAAVSATTAANAGKPSPVTDITNAIKNDTKAAVAAVTGLSKNTKLVLWIGGGIIGAVVIGFIIHAIVKKS